MAVCKQSALSAAVVSARRWARVGKQFTTTRRLRPGYDPEQVDAFLDKAEPRLAAMRATDKGRHD
jgi:DivIVA domain-containing protein